MSGQLINSKLFKRGEFIDVFGETCGKGFSGLQKRHNFARGPMTHGSKNHRAPGSIGMGTTPGRVFPGKKMSGQSGNKNTCIKRESLRQARFSLIHDRAGMLQKCTSGEQGLRGRWFKGKDH